MLTLLHSLALLLVHTLSSSCYHKLVLYHPLQGHWQSALALPLWFARLLSILKHSYYYTPSLKLPWQAGL
jgi:hypothetical protein